MSCVGHTHPLKSEYKEITFWGTLLSGNVGFTWLDTSLTVRRDSEHKAFSLRVVKSCLRTPTCHCHELFISVLHGVILVVPWEYCRVFRCPLWVHIFFGWIFTDTSVWRLVSFCSGIVFLGLSFSPFCLLHSLSEIPGYPNVRGPPNLCLFLLNLCPLLYPLSLPSHLIQTLSSAPLSF